MGDALVALAKRYGHTPVRCKDTPGFIVNHAGRGYVPESLRVLQEGVADFATIDRILVDAAGFRLGPFELLDLIGLDVSHAVMESMYAQYYDEPKYQPSFLSDPRVAAGLLGRKTGRGWYNYGKMALPRRFPSRRADRKASVCLVRSGIDGLVRSSRKSEANPVPIPFASSLRSARTPPQRRCNCSLKRRVQWRSTRCSASPSAAP